MPCPYANALGEPGKGVHAARIFGLARNDLLMTIAAAIITAYLFNTSFLVSFIVWFIAGEVLPSNLKVKNPQGFLTFRF